MPDRQRSGEGPTRGTPSLRRRELVRIVVLVLSLVALVLTSSALNLVTSARAQSEGSPLPGAKRAVIVSGPVHSLTARYRKYAKAMADVAAAQGMDVRRVFHPYATKASVKEHANGADLFIYVGHGNGWPSDLGPFTEATKNGLGLDPDDPEERGASDVAYVGADWLRANIEFAPNAVVILSHLSYASGNASSGMPIPARDVAVERVDNFANGFLAAGARVVWALGWQPGADVIGALHGEDATMDAVFMTRYREEADPLNGWIGSDPGYYESARTPGAQIHVDPHPSDGYLRAISGDLAFTTTEWRTAAALPPDTEPPVISEVSVSQAPATIASAAGALLIFTPNGDGISDSIKISHVLSENAFLDVSISKDGKVVRNMSVWSLGGRGSTIWDGRRDDGDYPGEGRFSTSITPTDRAGNVGAPGQAKVTVLSSMRAPRANPAIFHPSDGDGLAASSALRARLTKPATVSWVIKDASGTVVRHGIDAADHPPGDVRFVWDGRDDAGQLLPDGTYAARIRATRPLGSYGHDVIVHMMPFRLTPFPRKVKRGETVGLTFVSAEPMLGRPAVTASQQGVKDLRLKVRKVGADTYKATLTPRKTAHRGKLTVRIDGTDTGGGTQSQSYKLKLL